MKDHYDDYYVLGKDGRGIKGEYFVLRPEDPHAQKALIEYAVSVRKENPQLASDLLDMVAKARGVDSSGFKDLLL